MNSTQAPIKIEARLRDLKRADMSSRIQAVRSLRSDDPHANEILTRLSDDRFAYVRDEVVQQAGRIDLALGALIARQALTDPNSLVRCSAAEALGILGSPRDVWRLRRALADPEWVVRASAVKSLAHVGGRRSIRTLANVLRHDRAPTVRGYAAVALARFPGSSTAGILEAALPHEKADYSRFAILGALVQLGRLEYFTILLTGLESDLSEIRYTVLRCLQELPAEIRSQAFKSELLASALAKLKLVEKHKAVMPLIDELGAALDTQRQSKAAQTSG